jgi:hypothetical protein
MAPPIGASIWTPRLQHSPRFQELVRNSILTPRPGGDTGNYNDVTHSSDRGGNTKALSVSKLSSFASNRPSAGDIWNGSKMQPVGWSEANASGKHPRLKNTRGTAAEVRGQPAGEVKLQPSSSTFPVHHQKHIPTNGKPESLTHPIHDVNGASPEQATSVRGARVPKIIGFPGKSLDGATHKQSPREHYGSMMSNVQQAEQASKRSSRRSVGYMSAREYPIGSTERLANGANSARCWSSGVASTTGAKGKGHGKKGLARRWVVRGSQDPQEQNDDVKHST